MSPHHNLTLADSFTTRVGWEHWRVAGVGALGGWAWDGSIWGVGLGREGMLGRGWVRSLVGGVGVGLGGGRAGVGGWGRGWGGAWNEHMHITFSKFNVVGNNCIVLHSVLYVAQYVIHIFSLAGMYTSRQVSPIA